MKPLYNLVVVPFFLYSIQTIIIIIVPLDLSFLLITISYSIMYFRAKCYGSIIFYSRTGGEC